LISGFKLFGVYSNSGAIPPTKLRDRVLDFVDFGLAVLAQTSRATTWPLVLLS